METDLSLIEVSAEDDSLLSLQHTPIVSNDSSFLSCSPLLSNPRSIPSFGSPAFSTEAIKDEKDTNKPTNSSGEDTKYHNMPKENDSANKSGGPVLNVEPQKLKRKKKGGGFNVRKSLAWDRAFFTEQGVLDPLELSMLSGNTLPLIHEGREFISNECDGPSVSPGLKALESNLFKELPSFARNQGSRIASKTSAKLNRLAKEKTQPASPQNLKGTKSSTMLKTPPRVKRTILSAHDMNRSASVRSGCPRPVASSSLKRASNTSAANVTSKGRRISKQLTTKKEPLAVSSAPRSSEGVASHSKRNFSSQPATSQKNIGTKGTSSIKRSSQNDVKSGPTAGKIIPKVVIERETHSSSHLQLPKVSLPSSSFSGLSDTVVPTAPHQLNGDDNAITINAVSLPHNGGNTQHAQTQIPKPSGLRMPSPSMGFFCQSKPSNSQSETQRGLQPCKPPQDSIPAVSKAGVVNYTQSRPPQPYRKIPTCPSRVQSVTSVAENAASCGIIESELSDFHQKEALQLQVNSDRFNEANNDLQMHDADLKSPDGVKTCEKMARFSTKNIGLQINDIKLPLRSDVNVCTGSRDSSAAGIDLLHCVSPFQLVEVECPSGANKTSAKQHEEGSARENHIIKPDSHTENMDSNSDKTGMEVDHKSGLDELELTPQQAELKKHGTGIADPVSEVQGQRHNGTMMEDRRSSESCDKDYLSLAADYVPKVQDCGDVSRSPAHSTEMEHKNDEISGIDFWKGGLHVGEMQSLSPESSMLVRSCKRKTNTSAENSNWVNFNSQCANSTGQTEIMNCCVTLESDLCRSGSEVHATQLSGINEFELSPQQAELKEHGTSRVDLIFEIQNQPLNETLMEDCQSSKNGDKDCNSNVADDALEVQECGAVSPSPAHSTEMEHEKHETSATDCLKRELHVGEMKILSEESSLLVGNCKSLSETSAADLERMIFNSPSTKLVEQTEILDSCATSERGCQDICEPAPNGGFEHGKCSEACPEINDTFTEQPENAEQLNECFEYDLSPQLKNPDTFLLNQMNDEQSQGLDYSLTFGVNAEPTKDGSSETDYLNEGSHVEEVQITEDTLVSREEYESDTICEIVADDSISEKQHHDSGEGVGSKNKLSCSNVHPEEVKDSMLSLDKSAGNKKREAPTIKLPPNAVPFSDEWLAALEAAGEEVLARKGGAVQNSPPDKSLPEPSPWSPVKRKNQEIGPFDCTKLKIQQPDPL